MSEMIYTPSGLKIRLDPGRVEHVLAPVQNQIDLADAFLDIELWANFPNAVSSVCAVVTAVMTESWFLTLVVSLIGYAMANLFQQFFYSRFLKVLFPQFLGAWMIAIPMSTIVGYYLYRNGEFLVGVIQLVLVLANWLNITDFILFLLIPIRASIKKMLGYNFGDVELAFVQILNRQSRRLGVELDWERYSRRQT